MIPSLAKDRVEAIVINHQKEDGTRDITTIKFNRINPGEIIFDEPQNFEGEIGGLFGNVWR